MDKISIVECITKPKITNCYQDNSYIQELYLLFSTFRPFASSHLTSDIATTYIKLYYNTYKFMRS